MAFRPTQSRTFFRTLRTLIREEHPFARNTATLLPHAHDNSLLIRRTFRTATTFTPFLATSFAIGDTQPSDLLSAAATVAFGEHIAKSEDGHIGIVEDA
ncbi:hypothetical protein E4T39_08161 [Aureobasidium subglaciale]|nr:hypothetical protein E4T39_08161 [Aureobasidium subglaciale]